MPLGQKGLVTFVQVGVDSGQLGKGGKSDAPTPFKCLFLNPVLFFVPSEKSRDTES